MENRSLWIDALKTLATFAVIMLHVCVPLVNDLGNNSWTAGNFYNSAVRFCVPVFVMITGVLLLSKSDDLGIFLKKRFTRILYPFIFWSGIYLLMKIDFQQPVKEIFSFSIKALKSGAEYHLWYVYMLIGLYLITPILRKWLLKATQKEILYFLAIWGFVILLDLPIINKLYTRIDLHYFSGYIGYLILGYYCVRFPLHKESIKLRIIGFSMYLIAFIITAVGTMMLSKKAEVFDSRLYNFLSANVVIASLGIFMVFQNIKFNFSFLEKIIIEISKRSYGIYLSHVFVLTSLTLIGFNGSAFNSWIAIPVISIICLALSYFLTLLLSKTPLIGKYISG